MQQYDTPITLSHKNIVLLALIGLEIYAALFIASSLGQLVYPVIIASLLVFLTIPIIQALEKHIKIPRVFAVSLLCLLQVYCIYLLLSRGLPYLFNETQNFLVHFPNLLLKFIERMNTIIKKYDANIELDTAILQAQTRTFIKSVASLDYTTLEHTILFAHDTASQLISPLLWLLDLFFIPVLYFFLGLKYDKILRGIDNFTPYFLKHEYHLLIEKSNDILDAYLRGQIILVCTLAAGYCIGFSIIGLPYAISIGITTGLLSFIPYLGTIVGLVTSCIILFTSNAGTLSYITLILVFIVIHSTESIILIPNLVGQRVGLSHFTSIIALILGTASFGILGMLLAIPCTALAKHIFLRLQLHCQHAELL